MTSAHDGMQTQGGLSTALAVQIMPVLLLASCIAREQPSFVCPAGETSAVTDTIYFGLAKPGSRVSEDEWREFLNRDVALAVPEGLTYWPASGEWTSNLGARTAEDVYIVQLVHADTERLNRDIRSMVERYRTRFRQEAVLRVRTPGCAEVASLQR